MFLASYNRTKICSHQLNHLDMFPKARLRPFCCFNLKTLLKMEIFMAFSNTLKAKSFVHRDSCKRLAALVSMKSLSEQQDSKLGK